MKIILAFFLNFIFISLYGQGESGYWTFMESKIRTLQPQGIIHYSDKPTKEVFTRHFRSIISKGKLSNSKGDTIYLSKRERQSLLYRLKKCLRSSLPDSLFNQSNRISSDTIVKFVHRLNEMTKDSILRSSEHPKNKFLYWSFFLTRPILFRNDELMLYYFMYYDNSSGADELYICKKLNNKWVNWILVSAGAW